MQKKPVTPGNPFERYTSPQHPSFLYSELSSPGTFIGSDGSLMVIPKDALRVGHSPIISRVNKKQPLWVLKLTDDILDYKTEAGIAKAREIATRVGITNIGF